MNGNRLYERAENSTPTEWRGVRSELDLGMKLGKPREATLLVFKKSPRFQLLPQMAGNSDHMQRAQASRDCQINLIGKQA